MNDSLRCFVALGLSEGLRRAVSAFFAGEGRGIAGVRWTDGDRLHLTLKFLGDVAPDRLQAVCAAVAAAAAVQERFTLQLRGAGAFPSVQRPRVVWVGVGDGAAEAAGLAAAVTTALAPLGFVPESRPFEPHLTVGRFRQPPRDRAALPRLVAAVGDRLWGEELVPAVHLMRSELFPAGPIYSILAAIPLPLLEPRGK